MSTECLSRRKLRTSSWISLNSALSSENSISECCKLQEPVLFGRLPGSSHRWMTRSHPRRHALPVPPSNTPHVRLFGLLWELSPTLSRSCSGTAKALEKRVSPISPLMDLPNHPLLWRYHHHLQQSMVPRSKPHSKVHELSQLSDASLRHLSRLPLGQAGQVFWLSKAHAEGVRGALELAFLASSSQTRLVRAVEKFLALCELC